MEKVSLEDVISYIKNDAEIAVPIERFLDKDGNMQGQPAVYGVAQGNIPYYIPHNSNISYGVKFPTLNCDTCNAPIETTKEHLNKFIRGNMDIGAP